MKKPTIRNLKYFLLGMLTYLLIHMAWDWEGVKRAYEDGKNAAKADREQRSKL